MARDIEARVEQHYARSDLEEAILAALRAAGRDIDHLTSADLAPVDEFHSGGRRATVELASRLAIAPGMHLLDIGCGIGGPSRYFAETFGCRVTGIDLSPDYVRTAAAFARRVGLADRVEYRQAAAPELPFAAASFDGAYMMHVGMNIADKAALFAAVRRVVKPGGLFAIYDIMRVGDGELAFPLHWAGDPTTSFVATPTEYRHGLATAGFKIEHERDRRDFAREFFLQAQRRAQAGSPPPLGIHLLLKQDAAQKLTNMLAGLEGGVIAPVEIVACAV